MKIAVAGTGYVGLSLATLLSQKNEVVALDVIPEKVEMINNRISPIEDKEIEELKSSIRLKAIESYIILEKDILPECEEQAKQRRIKFIAVIDADDVDAMEETLSELAGGKDNQENSISSLKQSLGRLRSDDRKSYYYDDIEVYTPHEFQLHLEQITG